MCVPILRVHRDLSGNLTHVGGSTLGGRPWGLTVEEAASLQEDGLFQWFVEVPAGNRVEVLVKRTSSGRRYLTTSPDGISSNNLDSLPNMPGPLSGVRPPYPLDIPGPLTAGRMRITSIRYSGGNKLTALDTQPLGPNVGSAYVFIRPQSFWRTTPRLLYVDAVVPFPARYGLSLQGVVTERVNADDIVRRRALEAEGRGWWTMDFVLTTPEGSIDPHKPSRLTEVKIVVNPGRNLWARKDFELMLLSDSVNLHCRGGSHISVRFREPAPPPPPPPPPRTIMPAVVGLSLETAMNMLWGRGLRNVFVLGPAAATSELRVVSQHPAAGIELVLKEQVRLSTEMAAPRVGTKALRISNQSNRGNAVDIWLYDLTDGRWDRKETVPYQGQVDVELEDGHLFQIAGIDASLINCRSRRPDEIACIYWTKQGIYEGDADGLTVPEVIL